MEKYLRFSIYQTGYMIRYKGKAIKGPST